MWNGSASRYVASVQLALEQQLRCPTAIHFAEWLAMCDTLEARKRERSKLGG